MRIGQEFRSHQKGALVALQVLQNTVFVKHSITGLGLSLRIQDITGGSVYYKGAKYYIDEKGLYNSFFTTSSVKLWGVVS